MLSSISNTHNGALTTSQLTFQQLQELAILTRETWLTPIEALTREEAIILSINTEHLFPWVAQPAPTAKTYRPPVVKRWADYDEEDYSLPSLPASWKCSS